MYEVPDDAEPDQVDTLPSGRGWRRRSMIGLALAATPLAVTATASPAAAFCASSIVWSSGSPHDMFMSSSIPSGWSTSMRNSAAQWNGISGSTWNVNTPVWGTAGPPYRGGWSYFQSTAPGAGFGGAPGLVYNSVIAAGTSSGTQTWANIYFNSAYTWNQEGNLDQSKSVADVRTVATHEYGHLLFLRHPADCGSMTTAETNSVMNVTWTQKWTTNSDDDAGAASMY